MLTWRPFALRCCLFVVFQDKEGGDEKNIRRRIYDALNVLMAMEIIGKERKSIRWKGFENCVGGGGATAAAAAAAVAAGEDASQTPKVEQTIAAALQAAKDKRVRIEQRKLELEALALQYVGLNTLIQRNTRAQFSPGDEGTLPWPFLLLDVPSDTVVTCEVTSAHGHTHSHSNKQAGSLGNDGRSFSLHLSVCVHCACVRWTLLRRWR